MIKIRVEDFKSYISGLEDNQKAFLIKGMSIDYEEEVEVEDASTGEITYEEVTKTQDYVFVEGEDLWFYSGLFPQIYRFLKGNGLTIEVEDSRDKTKPRKFEPIIFTQLAEGFALRDDYQTPVVEAILEKRRGIIFVPTRGGKTEILICSVQNFMDYRKEATYVTIIVRKSPLADNMYDRFELRGYDSVGKFYGGRKDYHTQVMVCVVNSVNNLLKKAEKGTLRRKDKHMYERIMKTNYLIVDEIQDGSAEMFQYSIKRIFEVSFPDLAIACSGTPFMVEENPDSNIRDLNIQQLFGSVIKRVNDEYLIKKNYKARGNVIWLGYRMPYPKSVPRKYDGVYRVFITNNMARNFKAVDCVKLITSYRQRCLILVNRIPHGKLFLGLLKEISGTKRCVFSSSEETYELKGSSVKRVNIDDVVRDFNAGEIDVLIGTNIYNVGVDFPGLNWMIVLAGEGYTNDILNRQRTSRVLSPKRGDNNGYIIDFVDHVHRTTMKHSRSRKDLYSLSNYNQFASEDKIEEFLKRRIKS